jgi:2-isopropylmalate synthase
MPDSPEQHPLVFDWAAAGPHRFGAAGPVAINDETLRDGLQSPSVVDPPIETKLRLVHLMEQIGIEHASLGLPAAGPQQKRAVETLCREIRDRRFRLQPNCGGRTLVADVERILDIVQATGTPIEACLFIGSSPIRQLAEAWDLDQVLRHTRAAVEFAVREGLAVTYITEDTARSRPDHLRVLLGAAVDAGAARVCLCDTVGAAIPEGTRNLVGWVAQLLRELGAEVGIDWHGHRDRGLGLANTLAAIDAGASRVHGTALGIGERVGNTSTEDILINLHLLGLRRGEIGPLMAYVEAAADALGVSIPANAPIVGRDAFRTATGVHAAAVAKARSCGDDWLADRVYSSVPASWLGRRQEIEIGPLSGASNVAWFLRERGLAADAATIDAVVGAAKRSDRVLTETEVLAIIEGGRR